MLIVPAEYEGREQTFLKHRVLNEYVASWAHKLGSKFPRLWYVDCFSGPWNARASDLRDTSIAIGLRSIRSARSTWGRDKIKLGAIFIEKDARAFAQMKTFVEEHAKDVEVHAFHGHFGDHVVEINQRIARDAAFFLVDPTGWKGAAMKHIAPLVDGERRDVLVNVMFDHINRFKDDPRLFLREQMKEFFGLTDADLTPGLNEEELLSLYRDRLRAATGLKYIADLSIPHPSAERTKFRLVVGGHHQEVLRLFREIEKKVVGREAAVVRTKARDRREENRTGQMPLLPAEAASQGRAYSAEHDDSLRRARELVLDLVDRRGEREFRRLWPKVLQPCHITEPELAELVMRLRDEGKLVIEGMAPRERRLKDHHLVRRGS